MASAVTGADIGASGIRVLRLAQRGAQFEVLAGASTELPLQAPSASSRDRRKTVRLEVDRQEDSPEHIREVRTNLASLLRRGPFRGGRSVLGLNGSAGLIRYLQVPPVPPWKMEMMMKYEVEEQMAAQERSAFDYRILDLPDVGGQLTVMLAMIQERRLRTGMETARRAGLARGDVDLTALGLFNAYVYGHGPEEDRTAMLVDIGAETVDIVVVREGVLCFARSVPGGGSRFTAAVAEATGLTFEEAERLKRERGAILGAATGSPGGDVPGPAVDEVDEEDAGGDRAGEARSSAADSEGGVSGTDRQPDVSSLERKVSDALTRELGVLAGVLESSLMYCRAQTKQARLRPEEILVTGGGSMLPGFSEALSRRMRMRVSMLEPFRRVSLGGLHARELEDISEQAPRYAVALGLAASRLMPGAVTMSMVPEDVKARRRFLEAGLWVWYAVACVFLAAVLYGWSAGYRNTSVLRAEKQKLNGLLEKAKSDNSDFAAALELTRQRRAEVKTLEERVHSGRDIYQVLDLLRSCATGDFRSKILVVEANFRPPSKAAPENWERDSDLSFQKARRVFIRGFASVRVRGADGAENVAADEAVGLIKRYRLELQKKGKARGLVAEVKPRYTQANGDEVALEEDNISRHEFVVEIVLDEPGRSVDAKLASGGGK